MRIAICTDIYLPQLSGVADSIDILAGELAGGGHDVRIYAPRLAGAEDDDKVRRLPSLAVPGSAGGLVVVLPFGGLRDMRRFKPDVIHAHTFSAVGLLGVYAARRLGVPLVGTDHTYPAAYLHYLKLDFAPLETRIKRFAAWYYDHCAFVTAPSDALIDELRQYGMNAPAGAISNPIRTGLFRPLDRREAVKRKLEIGPDAVLLFGRIAAEKNWDLAIDVFAAVAERRHAELVVVGDGPDRSALDAELRKRNLSARSHIMGELHGEALVEAINACEVYLITSKSETQSMTLLQASASGLPVVAIRAGGLPEYVIDRKTGFVIDENDRERFVERIVSLLDDRGFARQLGLKGREFAMQFAPQAIASRHLAVYADALARRREVEARSSA